MNASRNVFAVAIALVALSTFTVAQAATSYNTGFEDFTLGAMNPNPGFTQNGWSGGVPIGFTNNNVGDEQIVDTEAHTGSQSWHFARGYGSPGEGTPYTPNLSSAVTAVGENLAGSVWFKAHTAGDGSSLAIESGNLIGDDRAEILAYITNTSGNLNVTTFDYPDSAANYTSVNVATSLDASIWHELAFSLTKTLTGNSLTVSVDGGSPVTVAAYLAEWRDVNSFPYSESSRLKFRPRTADDVAFNGFYIDDVSYAFTAAVPEPTTIALLGMAVVGCILPRRRRS